MKTVIIRGYWHYIILFNLNTVVDEEGLMTMSENRMYLQTY